MKKRRNPILSFLLIAALSLSLCGCTVSGKINSSDVLTMYIGLGITHSNYYARLRDLIRDKLGIDIRFVYTNTADTTSAVRDMLKNGDCPADIVTTSMQYELGDLAPSLMNLATYTDLPSLFSFTAQQEVSHDGQIYQLPFASRLIGMEYNKTLFEEQGWSLPVTFDELTALKRAAEEAGYPFAVSGGVATGHGFNYLMHVMGSEYLSTPDGTFWLNDYLAGNASIDTFAQACGYFEDYTAAGLFGHMHTADWNAKTEYSRTRALFYYNILNDISDYDGFRYNTDNETLFGAAYGKDGLPVVVEDPQGEAVFLNGEYCLYDETKEEHRELTRYRIPGAEVLHDVYGSMPWISRNSGCNNFVTYDTMYLSLDKKLIEKGSERKLEQAVKVLEFMASDEAAELLTSLLKDVYVKTSEFRIDESRMYYAYSDRISKGYIMPWYYQRFDADTIVNVGGKVNDYIQGIHDVTMEDVLEELDTCQKNRLNRNEPAAGTVSKTLDYADSAKFQAISNALSLQKVLDEAGEASVVSAALIPYMENTDDISEGTSLPLVQARMYAGPVPAATLSMYVNTRGNMPVAVRMTGKELNELSGNGFHTEADYGYDHVFPYALVMKDGAKVEANREYVVAVDPDAIEKETFNRFLAEGRVLLNSEGNACEGDTVDGMQLYLAEQNKLAPDTLRWN